MYESMQELARALGKRIKGMDKPTSLKRISDYLVEANLVEAPPADDTIVIYKAPGMGTFTRIVLIATCVLILLAGAIGYSLRGFDCEQREGIRPSKCSGQWTSPLCQARYSQQSACNSPFNCSGLR